MERKLSNLVVKVVNKNIRKEVDSVCALFGYQPVMPESAKKIKTGKKK